MRWNVEKEGWVARHLDRGPMLDYLEKQDGYTIYDLTQNPDGSFHAWLEFSVGAFLNESGEGWLRDENGDTRRGSVLIPVKAWQEDGWVVEEAEERVPSFRGYGQAMYDGDAFPWLRALTAQTEWGTVTVCNRAVYAIDNRTAAGDRFFGGPFFSMAPQVEARFSEVRILLSYCYSPLEHTQDRGPERYAGIMLAQLDDPNQEVNFPAMPVGNSGGASSGPDGEFDWTCVKVWETDWDGLVSGGGGSYSREKVTGPVPLPPAYRVRLYWDGKLVEELTLTEEDAR